MSTEENVPRTLEEQIKDIRDHAYSVADIQYMDERIRPFVQLALPLIDMIGLLVQTKHLEPMYEYEVVDVCFLSQRTALEGWQLVESVEDDMIIYISKQVQLPGNSYTTSLQEQVLGRCTRYMVRRPINSPVRDLLAQLHEERTRAAACLEETKKLKDELAKMNTSFKQLQEQRDTDVENAKAYVAAAEKEAAALRANARIAEAQLAKLAFALGDLRMKEILGS